ncbi:unnamed protein product [Oikopleura dioica]|uniref:TIL domain-containing protein n=1 Tax=Oikopleura dioica TaxID=34765 RepID=E4XIX0_OIKDI|nr:unnamed protein product [Oikopleura dioica]CBY39860.1 unnamed protein product [Oikopleura dioica]
MRGALFFLLFHKGLASVLLTAPACPQGEFWNNCALNPDCEVNCQKTHKNYCDRLCYQRCQCSEGLIRDLESGQCLPSTYCPRDFLPQPECPENEVWNECGNLCDGTCSRQEIECPKICAEGACACAKGHVRNDRGICVPFKECKPNVNAPECPENEFWNECGNLCEGTCDEPLKNCPKICADASCTCLNNFVRNELGNCIPQANCKPKIHCQDNAVYQVCGTNCPETCESAKFDYPVLCALSCNPSCQCIGGYVLDAKGNCIARENCWKSHPECPPNSHYNDCGSNCPETCETYLSGIPTFCNFGCNSACQCDEGFVLDAKHNCIPELECRFSAPECPENSSYDSCGTNCEETCESVLSEVPPFCNFGCNDGCFCDKGYVRSEKNGSCVPVESCYTIPKILVTCQEGSEWSECKAQKYCKHILSEEFDDGNLSAFCESGCKCNAGLYENNDGRCVSYEQCLQDVGSVSDGLSGLEDLGIFFESLIHLSNDTDAQEQIYGIIDQLFGENIAAIYGNQSADVLLGFEELLLSELGGNFEIEREKLDADKSYHPRPNAYQNGVENEFNNYESFADVGQLISSLAEGIPDFNPCGGFGDGIKYN